MKKIVILSEHTGGSYSWVTLLNALFPECEIEIRMISPDEEDHESCSKKIAIDVESIRHGEQF
jgi:hypothetical protein